VRRHTFNLLEVGCALGILGLTAAAAFSGMNLCRDMQHRFGQERYAVQVLDNVVERLTAQPAYTADTVRQIVAAEFAALPDVARRGLTAHCDAAANAVTVRVQRRDGKAPVSVRIPLS
jgi:type II secretory pathway pseudopilin PulG